MGYFGKESAQKADCGIEPANTHSGFSRATSTTVHRRIMCYDIIMPGPGKSYTDEALAAAVRDSTSMRQVGIRLGFKGAPKSALGHIERLGLSTEHFTVGQMTLEVLNEKRGPVSGRVIKACLLRNGYKEECSTCGISEWCGEPAPLQIDHINGDPWDQAISNLRILCANCHAQTPTYGAKKRDTPYNAEASRYGKALRTLPPGERSRI